MNKRVIILCYRKIIDIYAVKPWEKMVFDDSYMEFKMQAQNFTQGTPFTTYAELVNNLPESLKLSAMVTPSITGYVHQLNGITPDILNNVGRRFLKFDRFQLEIINSNINDVNKHQIAVNFFSVPLLWIDTINDFLLVTDQLSKPETNDAEIITQLVQLPSYVNIHSMKNVH
jgi:hypothetical protein